ncbi:hypothetical protein [Candidatus Thiodiazotropha sp. LNASS1]|uniref:hypothetical protein n=1 Tax=Candidatus Thiodiazotropha sp. LNASS1 TaxID=3096260 RepID=UPI00348E70C2
MTNPIFKHSLSGLSECLVSPATPYIGMPEIQGSDLKMKSKAWKYATTFVVVFIIFNPEMIELALFIDAIGLELFLMLFEIQLAAIISTTLNKRTKPIFAYLNRCSASCLPGLSWENIKQNPGLLIHAAPGPAAFMHMLVFSAATGVVLNAAS